MVHNMTTFMAWNASELKEKTRRVDWYWAVVLIALGGIVLSVIYKNYLLGFLLLLAGVLVIVYAVRKPAQVTVELSEQGLKVNSNMYQYQDMDAFWIIETKDGEQKLLIHTPKALFSFLDLHIAEEIDILALRDILLNFVPEVEMREPLILRISDRLGY